MPPTDENLYQIEAGGAWGLRTLPPTLGKALALTEKSEFVKSVIPEETIKRYLEVKHAEFERISNVQDRQKEELDLYFDRI